MSSQTFSNLDIPRFSTSFNSDTTQFSEKLTYIIKIISDEDGRFVVTSSNPNLQGMVTDGATESEAIKNALEAINAISESRGLNKEYNIMIRHTWSVSELPVVSSRDFIKYITKKGFVYVRTHGSHHVYKLNARMITIPERHEIGKGLLRAILNEAGIRREDFIREWNN